MNDIATSSLDALNALSAEELAARLSASPEERAAFVRKAAEAGVAEAQAVYGQMLLDGHGMPADQRAAYRWFREAARQGHVLAINMVGRCFDLGWGVAVDKVQAAQWYKVAADHGLDWGLYNYATLLALGSGVAEDKPAALRLFRRAAAMGNAKAINFVGSFYEDGWVVKQDRAEAARLYQRAAEGGDFRGQFNHGRMLLDAGRLSDALPWITRAYTGGSPSFRHRAGQWLADSPHAELRAIRDNT